MPDCYSRFRWNVCLLKSECTLGGKLLQFSSCDVLSAMLCCDARAEQRETWCLIVGEVSDGLVMPEQVWSEGEGGGLLWTAGWASCKVPQGHVLPGVFEEDLSQVKMFRWRHLSPPPASFPFNFERIYPKVLPLGTTNTPYYIWLRCCVNICLIVNRSHWCCNEHFLGCCITHEMKRRISAIVMAVV